MITKNDLLGDLKAMGLLPTDTLLVHSSMKAIGPVEGGADTVVDALMEYFADGLLLAPTHTWAQMKESYNVFDPATEPGCVGIIPNIFMKRAGVVRSLHPTHSMAAYGKNAAAYIAGEENCTTPCTPGGCWDRLGSVGAKILLLGVGHARNTFIHAVEERFDVPERLTEKPVEFIIKMPDGSDKTVHVHRHYNPVNPHISEDYVKLDKALFDTGAAKKVTFGQAQCILCDAPRLFAVVGEILSHEINCLIEREQIPESYYAKYLPQ